MLTLPLYLFVLVIAFLGVVIGLPGAIHINPILLHFFDPHTVTFLTTALLFMTSFVRSYSLLYIWDWFSLETLQKRRDIFRVRGRCLRISYLVFASIWNLCGSVTESVSIFQRILNAGSVRHNICCVLS